MRRDTIPGVLAIAATHVFTVCLTVWSRWTVGRIARKRFGSLRRIVKELGNGR